MSFNIETESGLVQNYTGVVVESWFGINAKYNSDATLLMLKIRIDEFDGDLPPEMEGHIVEQYSLGSGWATFDGGDTIEDPNRPGRTKFNENSLYAKFVGRLVELGAGDDLGNHGTPFESKTFTGLKLRYEEEVYESNRKDDETGKWSTIKRKRAWPAEYLGYEGEETEKAANADVDTTF